MKLGSSLLYVGVLADGIWIGFPIHLSIYCMYDRTKPCFTRWTCLNYVHQQYRTFHPIAASRNISNPARKTAAFPLDLIFAKVFFVLLVCNCMISRSDRKRFWGFFSKRYLNSSPCLTLSH